MNRRRLWLSIGVLFCIAVGSGYIPDLLFLRQMSAARAEGLIQPVPKEPFVSSLENAQVAYEQAFREEQMGLGALRANPVNETVRPTPFVRSLLNQVERASERPVYLPRKSDSSYPHDFEEDLRLCGVTLAKAAVSEPRLRAAARVARHLNNFDPLQIPTSHWAIVAEAVLDGVDRLKLPADARARVVDDLGHPDELAIVRRHVVAILSETEADANRSVGRRRQETAFLSFWRGFMRDAPKDPAKFARAISEVETKIKEVDDRMGYSFEIFSRTSTPPKTWHDWADGLAKVVPRLDSGDSLRTPRPSGGEGQG